MKKLIFALSIAVLFAVSSSASAAAKYKMKMGWAETADPYGHPGSAAMTVFKDYVENLTAGQLEVKLYPAAQLGDAKSMLAQVKRGVIQSCSSIPSGMIAGRYYKNLNVFEIPYLFKNTSIAWRVLRPSSPFFKDLSEDMAKEIGIRPLAFFIEGQRHFTNNVRAIESAADMKGLKIRTMEVPAHMQMVKAFGATPTPISWVELYGALQTGVIDGQENPIGNILYAKLYEVQKYLTLDGHVTLLNTWVINEKWFNKLPSDIQGAIIQAAEVAAITNRGMSQVSEAVGLQKLQKKDITITVLSQDELANFARISQKSVNPYIQKSLDDKQWLDRILDEIKQAESYYNK